VWTKQSSKTFKSFACHLICPPKVHLSKFFMNVSNRPSCAQSKSPSWNRSSIFHPCLLQVTAANCDIN
jgi:hypothetical protein